MRLPSSMALGCILLLGSAIAAHSGVETLPDFGVPTLPALEQVIAEGGKLSGTAGGEPCFFYVQKWQGPVHDPRNYYFVSLSRVDWATLPGGRGPSEIEGHLRYSTEIGAVSARRLELKKMWASSPDTYLTASNMTLDLDDAGHITHIKARLFSSSFGFTVRRIDASFEGLRVRQFEALHGK